MTFAWPWMLVTLAAVPLLVLAYRRDLRRRARRRAELAALGLVPASVRPAAAGRLSHAGPLLLLAALTVLLVALGRPSASVAEPRREGTVILAFDVSTSMAAKDLAPTRLEAAKKAARAFVLRQPSSIRLGVVAFGDSAVVAQQPTTERGPVLAAIDRLAPQGGTALGRGLVTALSAIAGKPLTLEGGSGQPDSEGPQIGYYGSSVIVLLSDGENTTDPDPQEVAQLASAAGVRVYPIGLGSAAGTVLQVDGFQISTALDEAALKQIAATTEGSYHAAADAGALAKVYGSIHLAWTTRTQRREITSWFAAAAALLVLLAAGWSVTRSGRVV
ncbi:vWA domain-containing protein [Pedococcus sp. 5OH_020]|uniref:vWA domain-containing protein n=1 Tax=Pedococcus sp. 5OH_020 TaxID=2989814 RepID=UPI0022E9987D|nr:VWA domain-containing protein [Pedococcus sp. 5OH_020]